jgi:hypothetical protein
MAKRKSLIDFEKRWGTGAGQGEGSSYKPWLTVQSFPSLGRSHRVKGWKTFRKHQLLSDLELQYFYVLEWSQVVVDVREQYPLWPRETTKTVADQLGLKHPIIPGTTELSVMTTDFLITIEDQGQSREIARTTKYVKELEKPRAIEKLEIERLWWEAKGVDWGIVTENDLPQTLIRNIKNLHDLKTLDGFPQLQQDHRELVQHLTTAVQKGTRSLASIASRCDTEIGLASGSFLALAKHLIANRRWVIDMESEFRPTQRLELLDVSLEV